jgi:hypothetical protein
VRAVDEHADAVHLGDQLQPVAAETGIHALVAAGRRSVHLVVDQQHVADAEPVEQLHHVRVALQAGATLEVEAEGELAGRPRRPDLGDAADEDHAVGARPDHGAHIGDVVHGPTGAVEIAAHGEADESDPASVEAVQHRLPPLVLVVEG